VNYLASQDVEIPRSAVANAAIAFVVECVRDRYSEAVLSNEDTEVVTRFIQSRWQKFWDIVGLEPTARIRVDANNGTGEIGFYVEGIRLTVH